MPLVKSKGNMYPDLCTWNPIKGICPHQCSYCYMRKFWARMKPPRLVESELKTDLYKYGKGVTVFVGSGIDMFAVGISCKWIQDVLDYCSNFPENTYLFQSKNPSNFWGFLFPPKRIFGTTIETNRYYYGGLVPVRAIRVYGLMKLEPQRMVSIEPIMDFDLDVMVEWMKEINPLYVSIGADSKGNHLPEPPPEKIRKLIAELRSAKIEVREKSNLKRLKI